jgi:hypothetical protein
MSDLDLKSFGAVADGKKDNAAIINYAAQVAKAEKSRLHAGPGKWAYSDVLNIEGIEFYGDLDASGLPAATLWSLNPLRAAIRLYNNSAVRVLRLSGVAPAERVGTWEAHRVIAPEVTGFQIEGMLIESAAASSIYCRNAIDGLILNNRVIGGPFLPGQTYGTLRADGIHITHQSKRIVVEGNVVRRSGDDGIAVIGYQDSGAPSEITVRHNDVREILWGRGMSVNGGTETLHENNFIADVRNAAGFIIAQETGWKNLGSHDVQVRRCTIVNCGGGTTGHPGFLIYSDGAERHTDVVMERLVISQDPSTPQRAGLVIRDGVDRVSDIANLIIATPARTITANPTYTMQPYVDGPVGVSTMP